MSYTCKVIIREDYIKKDGTVAVALQVIIDRKMFRIPLKLSVKPEQFDKTKGLVKAKAGLSKVEANDMNMIIKRELAKANELGIRARLLDKPLSKKEFMQKFNNFSGRSSFIQFVELEIEKRRDTVGDNTIETYTQMFKKLKKYNPDLLFSQINLEMVEGFEGFLKKQNLSVNTRWKHHKNLCNFINRAIKKEIRIKNPYDSFKVIRGKGTRVFLDKNEIGRLTILYRSKELQGEIQNTLGAFLFSCLAGGIRISDMQTITHGKHLKGKRLVFQPKKTLRTGKVLIIPVPDAAFEFITTNYGRMFQITTSQKINEDLKVIAKLTGISKNLTFHIARHTFATQYLLLGGDIVSLKEILGHSKLETTMIYSHIVDSLLMKNNMQKLNELLKV